MDYQLAVSKIYEGAEFNPACFDFTEEEARNKKLWRDKRPMPTQDELDAAILLANNEAQLNKYKEDRKKEYNNQGLTFNSFIEMLIENDQAAISAFRSKRNDIKAQFPKE